MRAHYITTDAVDNYLKNEPILRYKYTVSDPRIALLALNARQVAVGVDAKIFSTLTL